MDAQPKPSEDAASQLGAGFVSGLSAEQSEMVGKFLLAPVPREEIPPEIRRAARKGIDWVSAFYGTLFLLAGLFCIFVASPALMLNDLKLYYAHREVTGVITYASVTPYKTSRGGTSYLHEYAFEFIPDNSTGVMQGRYRAPDEWKSAERWHTGDKVQIWYLPHNAAVARIKGTSLGHWEVLLLTLMMLTIAGAIWWSEIRSRKRLVWLLAKGLVGEFRVTNVVWVRGGKAWMDRVRVECERTDDKTDDGRYCGELLKQRQKNMKLAQNLKSSGRTVFGLYDPRERERGKERRRLEIPETWFW